MKRTRKGTRIALVLLAALLALPIAQTTSPAVAKDNGRLRTVTRTFRNTSPVNVPKANQIEPLSASPYPSQIRVSGLKGPIGDVNLRLRNFIHFYPDDVQVLLVGPGGQTAQVMGNIGGSGAADDVTLLLDDEAAMPLPNESTLQSGAFQPTAAPGSTDIFNAPAPIPSGNSLLSVFDGGNPNGTWSLYVQDEDPKFDPGVFQGGWELEIMAQVKAKKRNR